MTGNKNCWRTFAFSAAKVRFVRSLPFRARRSESQQFSYVLTLFLTLATFARSSQSGLVHELDAKGASLRVLEPEVTTTGDMGRMVITVLGMVADMELKFIRDRQRAGIDAAKDKGVYKGRRKTVDDVEIRRLASEGTAKAQIARHLGVSRMTVYRALKKTGAEVGAE